MKKQKIIVVFIFLVILLNSCSVFFEFDVPRISVTFRNNVNESLLVYVGSYSSSPETILRGRSHTVTMWNGQAVYIYGAHTGKEYVSHRFYGHGYYVIDGF